MISAAPSADRVHSQNTAASDALQDGRDRRFARTHRNIDSEAPHQRPVAGIVDKRDRGPAAGALRQQSRQDVHLVVVGDRDHCLGESDVDLDENLGVQRVSPDDGGPGEPLGQVARTLRQQLDNLHIQPWMGLLQLLRQEIADVTAAQ